MLLGGRPRACPLIGLLDVCETRVAFPAGARGSWVVNLGARPTAPPHSPPHSSILAPQTFTMVNAPLTAAIVALAPLGPSAGPSLAGAFTASHFSPALQQQPSSRAAASVSLAAGKGFGEKPAPAKPKSAPVVETTIATSPSADEPPAPAASEGESGSKLLATLRSREAEKRDAELRKLRDLRETDALLAEDAGAAAIPERVAQRMGKRMLPFVGIPLFGSFASFIGFWYMATYKDMEFQPALVATTSFVFLAIGLLVSVLQYD